MGLPTFEEVKAYLKVETEVEDDLIENIRAGAYAWVRRHLGVPLVSESRTFRGRWPRSGDRREPQEQLKVPLWPCSESATVTNVFGEEVDSSLYAIDGRKGEVNAVYGESFGSPPYTVELQVGYDTEPDYFENAEPILRDAILWACSDFYRRRNPGAEYEQSGGQVSITYTKEAIPAVLYQRLETLRPRGKAW